MVKTKQHSPNFNDQTTSLLMIPGDWRCTVPHDSTNHKTTSCNTQLGGLPLPNQLPQRQTHKSTVVTPPSNNAILLRNSHELAKLSKLVQLSYILFKYRPPSLEDFLLRVYHLCPWHVVPLSHLPE